MRYVLPLCIMLVVASSVAFGETDRIWLAQIVVQPAPQPQLLPLSSTTNTCVINCDTSAMICSNSCVVVGSAAATTAAVLREPASSTPTAVPSLVHAEAPPLLSRSALDTGP